MLSVALARCQLPITWAQTGRTVELGKVAASGTASLAPAAALGWPGSRAAVMLLRKCSSGSIADVLATLRSDAALLA